MLKIIAERIPTKNGPRIEILEICALMHEDLPEEYVSSGIFCYKGLGDGLIVGGFGRSCHIPVGKILTLAEYTELEVIVGECGQRLYEINNRIRQENKDWTGIFVSSF